jgi:galactokinase
VSAERARELFEAAFGRAPAVVARAPGRVNLIGEHLDYNAGDVLPIALGLGVSVAMDQGSGAITRIASAERRQRGEVRLADARPANAWHDYVSGSLRMLGERGERGERGVCGGSVDVAVAGDVPLGAGLASSAALEVAVLTAAASLWRVPLAPRDAARLGRRAEVEFVGVPCGIMDQIASAMSTAGHALLVHCGDERVERVPFHASVLIFDTAVPRDLRRSAFAARKGECDAALVALRRVAPELGCLALATEEQIDAAGLPAPLDRRARHVVSEMARVQQAVSCLRAEARLPGELLLASHTSLRDDYVCSAPELDWFVEYAMSWGGIEGARLTGAGWGGCAIALGEEASLTSLASAVLPAYQRMFGRQGRVWLERASAGAAVVTRDS